jgi:lysophospholipase L1-like esterase
MYRFQINAYTQPGESIGLVGSIPELGHWQVQQCIPLKTSAERYPLWWTDRPIDIKSPVDLEDYHNIIEYKYLRLKIDGTSAFEALDLNRWIPIDAVNQSRLITLDDGEFNYGQPQPFGYFEQSELKQPLSKSEDSLKILVIGSSVALGYKSWLLKGWSGLLEETLQQKYGHQLINVSEVGANVGRTIERFPSVVAPEQPDIVIIALSLGNEGLSYCAPHQRRAVQRRFESGLQQLVKMTRELGASPILGGVYPHGDYSSEHAWLLKETHDRMMNWGVPILNWLAAVENGQGRWKEGTSFDPAHPNTVGHHLMYQAIDLSLFAIAKPDLAQEKQRLQALHQVPIFLDLNGFRLTANLEAKRLQIVNPSGYSYTIAPYWKELQTAIQEKAGLTPGIYFARQAQDGTLAYFAVAENGGIETILNIPPQSTLDYTASFNFFSPNNCDLLFYDGHLGILKEDDRHLFVVNESDKEYNIQPMWQEVRSALKALPSGVYEDPINPDATFRTLIVGLDGLESRVKAPPKSAIRLQYKCALSERSRVAILPLGDRCAVRMMLYKMQYDGPAFPFDLTRTTQIGDVADMIESRFFDMWNPAYLHYSKEAGRIYHGKWSGLSFAHEVEETDDPDFDMSPVHERMRSRYSARAERFWYTLEHCDKVLFVRTGLADRGGVMDLVHKLSKQCQGKPFHLLLLSPQSSEEFADLPNVLHYDLDFNPDRMYEDAEHWMYCTDRMREILEALGISSKNLFWCPPNPPKA